MWRPPEQHENLKPSIETIQLVNKEILFLSSFYVILPSWIRNFKSTDPIESGSETLTLDAYSTYKILWKERFFCFPIPVPTVTEYRIYLWVCAISRVWLLIGLLFSVPRENLRGRTRDRGDPGVAKLYRLHQHPARLSPVQTNGPVFWLSQVCDTSQLILTACFSLVNNFRDGLTDGQGIVDAQFNHSGSYGFEPREPRSKQARYQISHISPFNTFRSALTSTYPLFLAACSFYEVLYFIHSFVYRLRPPGRKTPPIRKQTKVQMPRSVNMEKVRSQSLKSPFFCN